MFFQKRFGNGKSDGICRNHTLIVFWMRLHIFPKDNFCHYGTLRVPCKKKRPAFVIMFKIIIQSGIYVCALFPFLIFFQFFMVKIYNLINITLPVERGKHIGRFLIDCSLILVNNPSSIPHLLIINITDWFCIF